MATYSDLSEEYPNELRPLLDRDGIDESILSSDQKSWRKDGVLVKERFLPDTLIDAYVALRMRVKSERGWADPCPYLRHDAIKDIALYPPLMDKMRELIGNPVGLHLNLTSWVSVQTPWTSVDFSNPAHVYSHSVLVWIALEDISPDSGPLQFVRGSHRWPPLKKDKILQEFHENNNLDEMVGSIYESEIKVQVGQIENYLPKKGDVLICHGRLILRNSAPKVPGTPRRALVCCYSSLFHRKDMPARRAYPKTGNVFFYFPDFTDKRYDEVIS